MNYPEIDRLISRYRDLTACRSDIAKASSILSETFRNGGMVLAFGSGAGSFTAEQFVSRLLSGFQKTRPIPASLRSRLQTDHGEAGEKLAAGLQGGFPALALTGPGALLSTLTPSGSPELVFAQQVYTYGRAGDTVLSVSPTEAGPAQQAALRLAGSLDLKRIVLTGRESDNWQGLADCIIRVPRITDLEIQELHLPVSHTLCVMLEQEFFTS